MSDEDIRKRLEGTFSETEAAPGMEDLFSDTGTPSLEDGAPAELPAAASPELAPVEPITAVEGKERVTGTGWRQRLANLRLQMFSRERLTLSLEANEVRLLIAQGQDVLYWDRVSLPDDVLRNGQVVDPAAFGEAVADLIEEAGGPRRKVVVSLSGQRSLVRILKLPAVPPRLLDETVRRTARRELPLPVEELYLSWEVIGDRNASQLQVFTLGVPREMLDSCVVGLRSAGLRPQAMDLKPLTLVRAANLPDVLLVDVEAETESVVLTRGFVPYIVRSVALPGEAERPLAERAEHLATEIQRTLDFYSSSMAAGHPAWSPAVCLTGVLGGEEDIRMRIGVRWPLVEPAPSLPLPEELPLLPYLVNVGLVTKRVS